MMPMHSACRFATPVVLKTMMQLRLTKRRQLSSTWNGRLWLPVVVFGRQITAAMTR
jgi:hypothetical protein